MSPLTSIRGGGKLRIRDAVLLGAIQGPAEALPVSSSAHVMLVPALLGWEYAELDDDLRKAFEVALHAGTAVALIPRLRLPGRAELVRQAATALPAAVAGLLLERPIERRLGSLRAIAITQIAAGAALALGDLSGGTRAADDAGARDALLVGVAQAVALAPGVSRAGATVTAARALGFSREAAGELSAEAALPVILGATALKAWRLARTGLEPALRPGFAAGTLAAALSTAASGALLGRLGGKLSYLPIAGYRVAIGVAVLRQARDRA